MSEFPLKVTTLELKSEPRKQTLSLVNLERMDKCDLGAGCIDHTFERAGQAYPDLMAPVSKNGHGAQHVRAENIVVYCSRIDLQADTVAKLRGLLLEDIDWSYLISLAQRHAVIPLLYRALSTYGRDAVPTATLNDVRDLYYSNVAGNLGLAREMCEIVHMFRNAGISVLPHKGVMVAASIYGSLALRTKGDIDFLIRKPDVDPARELLVKRGYTALSDPDGVPEDVRAENQFFRESDGVLVELRWKLNSFEYSSFLNLDFLSQYILPFSLLGNEIPNLSAEETLLILCVHGSKHRWSRLMWICDVAELLRAHPVLDWKRLATHASQFGLSHAVGSGLLIARDTLNAPVPEEALMQFAAAKASRLAACEARKHLFSNKACTRSFFYQLHLMEWRRDRIRHYFRFFRGKSRKMLPNENDRAIVSLPAKLSFLYYLVRPMRVLLRVGYALTVGVDRAAQRALHRILRHLR